MHAPAVSKVATKEPAAREMQPDTPTGATGHVQTSHVQMLQRRIGNRATARLLGAKAAVDALGPGAALPAALSAAFGRRFGQNLDSVRVHPDAAAGAVTSAHDAHAMTWNEHILFAPGAYAPATAGGRSLLAHELVHVLQFRGPPAGLAPREMLEAQARQGSGRVLGPSGVYHVTGGAAAAQGFLYDNKRDVQATADTPPNPFADWTTTPDSLLLLFGDDRLFILPGAGTVFTPTEKSRQEFLTSSSHVTQDLGTLFEVPATGASGTRIFPAGKRSAIVLDAGYDPTPGQSQRVAAVYVDQVMAIANRYGIRNISRIQPIHGHSDHVIGIPAVVGIQPAQSRGNQVGGLPGFVDNLNVKAANVVVPAEYRAIPAVARAMRELAGTTAPTLVQRGFGQGFAPQSAPKDKGGPGGLYEGRFMIGELVVDLVGLRSALADARRQPDPSSYLTRVTRRTDNARVVILGDFRGATLETIRNTMEAQRPGSWNEYFRDVSVISGFSHHVGRMEAGDIEGLMSVLDATLFTRGRLRVVEQTNLGVSSQARADTLELAARLGIELVYTDMPTPNAGPSAAGATKDTATVRGPNAVAQPPIASPLTAGLERLRGLDQSRVTIEHWRPWLEQINENGKVKVDGLVAEINASIAQLQSSLQAAARAAMGVRVEPLPGGASGPRDYTAGGAAGRVYTDALTRIPAQTKAEQTLTPENLRDLEELRKKNVEEVPLKVAVYRAVTLGEYSDQAFTHMMSQLNPATRDELIRGRPRRGGGLAPRNVAFERVRAQYNFEREVLPGETISVSHLSPTGRVGARGVAGLLLVAELWSSIGEPLWQSHQISKQVNVRRNLAPFLRRLAFWQTMTVMPKIVGVDDPTFGSPSDIQDATVVVNRLAADDLDALYIKAPGIDDAGVLAMAGWLIEKIRNYDEYATFFEDSFQDAMRYRLGPGQTWDQAIWQVRVGRYETSGSNHVEEEWMDHPKLTEFMRRYIAWLIGNTNALLTQEIAGGTAPPEFFTSLGTLAAVSSPSRTSPSRRVRLKSTIADAVVVVPWTGDTVESWNVQKGHQLERLKVPGTAEFFVLERRGAGADTELRVSGANFSTYAAIRDLETTNLHYGTYGSEYNHAFMKRDRNKNGWVWIDEVLTEPGPTAAAGSAATAATGGPVGQPAPRPDLRLTPAPGTGTGRSDVLSSKLPIGPRVFGPLPNDPTPEEKKRWIGPAVGGSF